MQSVQISLQGCRPALRGFGRAQGMTPRHTLRSPVVKAFHLQEKIPHVVGSVLMLNSILVPASLASGFGGPEAGATISVFANLAVAVAGELQ